MTRFSSAITRIRSCTNSASVNSGTSWQFEALPGNLPVQRRLHCPNEKGRSAAAEHSKNVVRFWPWNTRTSAADRIPQLPVPIRAEPSRKEATPSALGNMRFHDKTPEVDASRSWTLRVDFSISRIPAGNEFNPSDCTVFATRITRSAPTEILNLCATLMRVILVGLSSH